MAPKDYIKFTKDAKTTVAILGLPLDDTLKDKRTLIIGSGSSEVGARMKEHGAIVLDTDPHFTPVGEVPPAERATAAIAKGERLPIKAGTINEVLISWVLCVADDPRQILEEAIRVVAPNGKIRIYPILSFVNLQEEPHGGTKFLRRGMDHFTIVIEGSEITEDEDRKRIVELLFNEEKFCFKPDPSTWEKRMKGYYYDKEHDLPKEEWWLGDAS